MAPFFCCIVLLCKYRLGRVVLHCHNVYDLKAAPDRAYNWRVIMICV